MKEVTLNKTLSESTAALLKAVGDFRLLEYVGLRDEVLNPVTYLFQRHIPENKVNPARYGTRVQTAPLLCVSSRVIK